MNATQEQTTATTTTTRKERKVALDATAGKRPIHVTAGGDQRITGANLLELAYGGTVQFHKERVTGTMRRWPVLAPESGAREQAESIAARRADGVKVADLAEEHNTSVATIRRMITALEFTLALESASRKNLAGLARDAEQARKEQAAVATDEGAEAEEGSEEE